MVLGCAAPVDAAPGQLLFRITDERIAGASGFAVGLASPGVIYVQNDSDDRNRFFALDVRTGATAATITVPGATNVDWEDIAISPDADGRPSAWLADIGDNRAQRREVDVYRVDEPNIARTARGRSLHTDRPDVWRLRYPGGAVDAESFAVTPAGTGYIVTKSFTGDSTVYRLPPHPDHYRCRCCSALGRSASSPTGPPDSHGVSAR